MKKTFHDLGIGIEPKPPRDPPMMIPETGYVDHIEGDDRMKDLFPGVTSERLPGRLGATHCYRRG